MNRATGIVFVKEITNALRDRRTLISTVLVPLVILPLVMVLPMLTVGRQERTFTEQRSAVAVVGADRQPALAAALTADSTLHVVADADTGGLKARLVAAMLVIARGDTSGPARVRLIVDQTRTDSRVAGDKLRAAVNRYAKARAAARLTALGLDPGLVDPVQITEENAATPREMAGFFLGLFVGMLAVMGTITGGMVLAIDATAGEKERRTLEVLLAAPAPRRAIVLGKFLATWLAALTSVLLMALGMTLTFTLALRTLAGPGGGFGIIISPGSIAVLLVTLGLTAAFAAALELAIALFARSYREAQTYLTPLSLVVVVPVVFMPTISTQPAAGLFFVPLLNAMLLVRELLMGVTQPAHVINTLVTCLVCTVVALRFAQANFNRESVLLRS